VIVLVEQLTGACSEHSGEATGLSPGRNVGTRESYAGNWGRRPEMGGVSSVETARTSQGER
jgi:hypothetical protein